jgi:hypothetical protein
MASCETCERKPSRVDGQCPVYNMADGRHFTDYRPRCAQNNSMVENSPDDLNTYEYRMYLQHNATKLMNENKGVAGDNNKCEPCFDFNEDGTMLPEVNKFDCNSKTCSLVNNKSNGIGTGRQHNVSIKNDDVKQVPNNSYFSL